MSNSKANLIVFTGPSGVGKGTVVKKLFAEEAIKSKIVFSVSATTRNKREGEEEGVNYFFKSKDEFGQMIKNDELIEWAEFVGNFYGTPKDFVDKKLAEGLSVFLEIEVQGALQIMQKYPDALTVFLMPPDLAELEKRLRERATEDEATLQKRLLKAREEVAKAEQFKFVVVNDDLDTAVAELRKIFISS